MTQTPTASRRSSRARTETSDHALVWDDRIPRRSEPFRKPNPSQASAADRLAESSSWHRRRVRPARDPAARALLDQYWRALSGGRRPGFSGLAAATDPTRPGRRTRASRGARAALPRSRLALSVEPRLWQGQGREGSRGESRGGAFRRPGRRGAHRAQPAARASASSPDDCGSRGCPSSGSTRSHGAHGARRASAGRTAKRVRDPRYA
jgi:hypothetical protein